VSFFTNDRNMEQMLFPITVRYITFGAPSGAEGGIGNAGSESSYVRPIRPAHHHQEPRHPWHATGGWTSPSEGETAASSLVRYVAEGL
jgi:hypothetical protein